MCNNILAPLSGRILNPLPCPNNTLTSYTIFFESLISSQSSGSNGALSEDDDEPLSMCSSPIQRWIDQACGYSFHQDFLLPTHPHEFHFIIDYMFICAHGYYVLDLSLLYYIIKHRGR
jgi:hypothetical protein